MEKGIRLPFDKDAFMATWNMSTGPSDTAQKLGRTKASCQSYAVRLRKLGVEVKRFQRGRKKKA